MAGDPRSRTVGSADPGAIRPGDHRLPRPLQDGPPTGLNRGCQAVPRCRRAARISRPSDRDALRWFFLTTAGSEPLPVGRVAPGPGSAAQPMRFPRTPPWEVNRSAGSGSGLPVEHRTDLSRLGETFRRGDLPDSPDLAGAAEVLISFLTWLCVSKSLPAPGGRRSMPWCSISRRSCSRPGRLGGVSRSRRGPSVPVVLSRAELDRLFAQLRALGC